MKKHFLAFVIAFQITIAFANEGEPPFHSHAHQYYFFEQEDDDCDSCGCSASNGIMASAR